MPQFPHLEGVGGKPQGPSTRSGWGELEGCEAQVLLCPSPALLPTPSVRPAPAGSGLVGPQRPRRLPGTLHPLGTLPLAGETHPGEGVR